ncbi:unnamed protein product [Didymodactylos carnosus]|uniref:Retrotransposon gag domain-containing protein n=1 Tax=Didymodactylos carnosus TaxID=1234261 RepID=A0A815SRF0_9BILA|nr:unnamed protein product [Didymodactylos carnosus]CAF1496349.1 unnamed protein product [Didymodactylos carnosus]CAF4095767.1 unnamed protein product [Didymodactylos carnosus]CAF4358758.1 unnamed protein product [Didymodactylos carnosus]
MRVGSSAAAVERPVDSPLPPLISSVLNVTTITSPITEAGSTIARYLKPADFPTFTGKVSEDIDEWIAQVSAIKEYSVTNDSEILTVLPLVLRDAALRWFTNLGETRRTTLRTWGIWQHAL